MLIIRTNSINLLGRFFLLFIIITLCYNLIENEIINGNNKKEIGTVLIYFMLILFTYLFIIIIISFFGILKVELDKINRTIIFRRAFSVKKISTDEITCFYTTRYKGSRAKPWYGLLLKTSSNKSFKLTEQNLKELSELKEYFEEQGLKYSGEKNSFFSF
jgi:hypothetical protein